MEPCGWGSASRMVEGNAWDEDTSFAAFGGLLFLFVGSRAASGQPSEESTGAESAGREWLPCSNPAAVASPTDPRSDPTAAGVSEPKLFSACEESIACAPSLAGGAAQLIFLERRRGRKERDAMSSAHDWIASSDASAIIVSHSRHVLAVPSSTFIPRRATDGVAKPARDSSRRPGLLFAALQASWSLSIWLKLEIRLRKFVKVPRCAEVVLCILANREVRVIVRRNAIMSPVRWILRLGLWVAVDDFEQACTRQGGDLTVAKGLRLSRIS
mmetsp:Transcript_68146/g.152117  ORF Transcript_68146/g.152117 Transcript_68146/m.152117 type:complete len:271 (+) Transcript_68146:778-1590(+)